VRLGCAHSPRARAKGSLVSSIQNFDAGRFLDLCVSLAIAFVLAALIGSTGNATPGFAPMCWSPSAPPPS
jgi:hypothetical protein